MGDGKSAYKYCIIDDDEQGIDGLEPDYQFSSTWSTASVEYIAEDAAEDYYNKHDGWEADWPLKFAIFDMKGKCLGKFKVELYHSPEFAAGRVK